ncbi:class I SAM-dependent methyltransferase [Ilumatobacter sp.]|uniref:class I SAM-dependent methyltransferase n=1 Tax=Ilumatobacter sp. TaxID=1967498 RepID=UPI003AF6C61D
MVHDAARSGYDRQADVYASVRPSCHPALIERFIEKYARGVVADVGAGTGIFTSQLVDAGCAPIAIEPVASMRNSITAAHPQVTVIDGTAENTGLDDNSVDTVVAAQAFHWFDPDAAPTEIERILRPGGFLVCVWNVRDETSIGYGGTPTSSTDTPATHPVTEP